MRRDREYNNTYLDDLPYKNNEIHKFIKFVESNVKDYSIFYPNIFDPILLNIYLFSQISRFTPFIILIIIYRVFILYVNLTILIPWHVKVSI